MLHGYLPFSCNEALEEQQEPIMFDPAVSQGNLGKDYLISRGWDFV